MEKFNVSAFTRGRLETNFWVVTLGCDKPKLVALISRFLWEINLFPRKRWETLETNYLIC